MTQHRASVDTLHIDTTSPTPLIGRQSEIDDILALLADPTCRLLTLVGPGGIGKTRLALAVAATLSDRMTDGMHVVLLQSVTQARFIVPAIVDALPLSLHGQSDARDQLLNYLHDKELLLVLDNFEQLLDAGGAEILAAIHAEAPAVTMVVTSREVLNLREEWLYPVEGLPYPEHDDADDTGAYDAVQLFVERARRLRRDVSPADDGVNIVRICRLVEGMPLAIELAASWVKTLSCADIAEEIERSKAVLATRMRNVPERHRSMQAVFDQTWARLREAERTTFERLSVFRGGFRRDAAERVAAASLPILSALVDKSLLRHDQNGRYQIHELLRQYAWAQLASSPEAAETVRERHCTYVAEMLHERLSDIHGSRQFAVTQYVQAELQNVRAAWQWAVNHARLDALKKMAGTYFYVCQLQSRYLEGAEALEEAVRALEGQPATQERDLLLALLLTYQGWLSLRLGRLDVARDVLTRSLSLYRQYDSVPEAGIGTDPRTALGLLALVEGRYDDATEWAAAARSAATARGDEWNELVAHYVLANGALARGEYETAREHAERADAIAQAKGERWFRAYMLIDLGRIARAQGKYDEANTHFDAGYAIRQAFDDPEGMAVALSHRAEVALLQGDHTRARHLYQESHTIYSDINDRGGLATALNGLAAAAIAAREYESARQYLLDALQIATAIRFTPLLLNILVNIGHLWLQTGRTDEGRDLLHYTGTHAAVDRETKDRARALLARHSPEDRDVLSSSVPAADEDDLDARIERVEAALATPMDVPESDGSDVALIEPLSDRELEVLLLVAAGHTNRDIAERLVIAVGTVKAHTSNIYGKLGVSNRAQAVSRATELGLL